MDCYRNITKKPHQQPQCVKRAQRCHIILVFSVVWVLLVSYRLSSIQIVDREQWTSWAKRQHNTAYTIASERGPIYDRNGSLVAVSVPAQSIYVRPQEVQDREALITYVQQHLNLTRGYIESRLEHPAPFVWLKRQVARVNAQPFVNAQISGLGTVEEPRRYYPYKSAGSTLIGRVGIDGTGLSGVEAAFEKRLFTSAVKNAVARDALGNVRADTRFSIDSFALPKGKPLQLTIDADLQVILNKALYKGLENAKAKRATGLLVDSVTGDILAMDQVPTKNFNWQSVQKRADLVNHVVESVFEPGSTMKPFVAALALDAGITHPEEVIPCENGSYRFQRRIINDVHGHDELSVRDIVIRSSNIGMTKLGARLGAQKLYDGLRRFGFGDSIDLGLPGQTPGILRHPDAWAGIDVATHSFGQGLAVTPLQLVRAMSVISNGGYLTSLQLIPSDSVTSYEQVLSEKTAFMMQNILIDVVESEHGTGKRARVEGVRVGGKTGTAQKARTDGRGYEEGAYIASFLGFADASSHGLANPLVLLIAIDEPRGDSIYGGTLAGPVFQEVISKTVTHLSRRRFLKGPRKRPNEQEASFGVRRISYPSVS